MCGHRRQGGLEQCPAVGRSGLECKSWNVQHRDSQSCRMCSQQNISVRKQHVKGPEEYPDISTCQGGKPNYQLHCANQQVEP